MSDLFENPMGLMGFEFVEFASPTPNVLEPVFERMGFTKVATHRSKDVVLYRQGEINFIVNNEPRSAASYFAAEHGPSACGMARHFQTRAALATAAFRVDEGAQILEAIRSDQTCSSEFPESIFNLAGELACCLDQFRQERRSAIV